MGERLRAEHERGSEVLEHDSSALAGIHSVQEVPDQVSNVTSDTINQAYHNPTLQISEDPDGDAGVQCLAWSAPGILSLTRLCPLLSDGEYN